METLPEQVAVSVNITSQVRPKGNGQSHPCTVYLGHGPANDTNADALDPQEAPEAGDNSVKVMTKGGNVDGGIHGRATASVGQEECMYSRRIKDGTASCKG